MTVVCCKKIKKSWIWKQTALQQRAWNLRIFKTQMIPFTNGLFQMSDDIKVLMRFVLNLGDTFSIEIFLFYSRPGLRISPKSFGSKKKTNWSKVVQLCLRLWASRRVSAPLTSATCPHPTRLPCNRLDAPSRIWH